MSGNYSGAFFRVGD